MYVQRHSSTGAIFALDRNGIPILPHPHSECPLCDGTGWEWTEFGREQCRLSLTVFDLPELIQGGTRH